MSVLHAEIKPVAAWRPLPPMHHFEIGITPTKKAAEAAFLVFLFLNA